MHAGQIDSERFGTLHQPAEVGVTAQQVVDQLASSSFLAPNQVAASDGVAVRERRHRLVDHLQYGRSSGADDLTVAGARHHRQLLPQPTRGREVELHGSPSGDALLGGLTSQQTHRVEFRPPGTTSGGGCVGQQRQIVAEELYRNASGIPARGVRYLGQPTVLRIRRQPLATIATGTGGHAHLPAKRVPGACHGGVGCLALLRSDPSSVEDTVKPKRGPS